MRSAIGCAASRRGRCGHSPGRGSSAGTLAAAGEALERLAALEPFDVDTHRALIAVWLAQGRRTDASRRYDAYRARMARDFDEGPGFVLAEAHLDDLAFD